MFYTSYPRQVVFFENAKYRHCHSSLLKNGMTSLFVSFVSLPKEKKTKGDEDKTSKVINIYSVTVARCLDKVPGVIENLKNLSSEAGPFVIAEKNGSAGISGSQETSE